MTKRRKMILMTTTALVVVVVLSLGLGLFNGCSRQGFSYDTYRVVGGWGYDIKYKGELKIHQPFIPAISGSQPFPSRQMARNMARVLIDQIIETGSPSLSVETVTKVIEQNTPKK